MSILPEQIDILDCKQRYFDISKQHEDLLHALSIIQKNQKAIAYALEMLLMADAFPVSTPAEPESSTRRPCKTCDNCKHDFYNLKECEFCSKDRDHWKPKEPK